MECNLCAHMGTDGVQHLSPDGVDFAAGCALKEIKDLGKWLTQLSATDGGLKDLSTNQYWIDNRHVFED